MPSESFAALDTDSGVRPAGEQTEKDIYNIIKDGKIIGCFYVDFCVDVSIIRKICPNSLVVKHVLGKDESQVRFLFRAPQMHYLFCVCLFLFPVMYVLYTPVTKTSQYATSNTFVSPNGHSANALFILRLVSFYLVC